VIARPFDVDRFLRSLLPVAVVVGALALLLAPAAGTATAAGTPLARDAARAEVLRLINGERVAAGLKPLTVDLVLASRAHDSGFACPDGGSTPGRARDIALWNGLSHELTGCPGHTILDVMPAWGYRGWTGEILAYNYAASEMITYRYGCLPGTSDFDCAPGGTTTVASATAATAVRQWIDSPTHHDIMLGDYDRFGCGAWSGTGSTVYGDGGSFFACLFAKGGPSDRVDTQRPTVGAVTVDGTVLAAASDANTRAGAGLRLTARLADADALGRVAGWRVAVDGHDVVDEQGAGRVDSGRGSVQVSTTLDTLGLAPGTHVVTIRSQDLAGRWSAARTITLVLAP
jgi:uncharacterized protein YkwD